MSFAYRGWNMQKIVEALHRHAGANTSNLEHLTRVSRPTIRKLLRGQPAKANCCDALIAAARSNLSAVELDMCTIVHPSIYDITRSYKENIARGPRFNASDLPRPDELPTVDETAWSFRLSSPFGVSASALTANARWIRVLADAGASVITYKTVRTVETPAHDLHRNIGYVLEPAEYLNALEPESFPDVVYATDDCSALTPSRRFVLANCFGVPSPVPELWQRDVALAVRSLPLGSILILSIVGTVQEDDHYADHLAEDFARCAELALSIREHRPHVLEMNWSCPHSPGHESQVFAEPATAEKVARAVRQVISRFKTDTPLLAKIGYLPSDKLKALWNRTSEYLDGYSAINTKPVQVRRGLADHQREHPYFDRYDRAGVSGIILQRCALRTIESLANLADKDQRRDFLVLGMGGVMEPSDVVRFRDAGADIVQATTAFWHDLHFAAKVRQHLASRTNPDSIEYARRLELVNRLSGAQSIARHAALRSYVECGERIAASAGKSDEEAIKAFLEVQNRPGRSRSRHAKRRGRGRRRRQL